MLDKISRPVELQTVKSLLFQHYGFAGDLRAIAGERDHNFELTQADGSRAIVKIAHEDEAIGTLECQSQMVARILQHAPHIPVASEIPNLQGTTLTSVALKDGSRRYMRVNAYVPGVVLSEVPRTADTRKATGALVASLTIALEGFDHQAAHRVLLWDIQQAAALREHVHALPENMRLVTRRYLDRFVGEVAPRVAEFRQGVIHNDLNLHNLFVAAEDHGRITGCIDFGDMVWAPQVNDLAIAAAYQLDTEHPLQSILEFASAYHQHRPLVPSEIDCLTDLVAMRFVLTLAITHWRSKLHPENAAYILRNAPAAFAGLMALHEITPESARDFLYAGLIKQPDTSR